MCLNGSDDDDVQNHLVYSDLVSILRIREVWIIAIFTWENVSTICPGQFNWQKFCRTGAWPASYPKQKGTTKNKQCYSHFLKNNLPPLDDLSPRSCHFVCCILVDHSSSKCFNLDILEPSVRFRSPIWEKLQLTRLGCAPNAPNHWVYTQVSTTYVICDQLPPPRTTHSTWLMSI